MTEDSELFGFEEAPQEVTKADTHTPFGHGGAVPEARPQRETDVESHPLAHSPAPRARREFDDIRGLSWDDAIAMLQQRRPDTSEGILFCLYKLVQDPEASMRDFRDEAETRGVKLSGRSLHSAKVMLGLAQPAVRRAKSEVETSSEVIVNEPLGPVEFEPEVERPRRASTPRRRAADAPSTGRSPVAGLSVEGALRSAVEQIQLSARSEATRLRDAMRHAIEILEAALDED